MSEIYEKYLKAIPITKIQFDNTKNKSSWRIVSFIARTPVECLCSSFYTQVAVHSFMDVGRSML